jgi:hypothetical protein
MFLPGLAVDAARLDKAYQASAVALSKADKHGVVSQWSLAATVVPPRPNGRKGRPRPATGRLPNRRESKYPPAEPRRIFCCPGAQTGYWR